MALKSSIYCLIEMEEFKQNTPNDWSFIHNRQYNDNNLNNNPIGLVGFITSVVAIFLVLLPIVNLIIWLTGLILSIIGMSKKPKTLAVAGLIISGVTFLVLIVIIACIVFLATNSQ